MIQLFLMLGSVTLGLIFTQMIHPLAMGLLLLLQTTLIAFITGLMTPTFWFSYILFLVFLGGMLVLFIYVTSLASNEMFSMSALILTMSLLTGVACFFTTLLNDPLLSTWPSFPDLISPIHIMMDLDAPSSFLIKLYHAPSSLLTLLLVLYLFFTLIAVVSVTNINGGPLRPFN